MRATLDNHLSLEVSLDGQGLKQINSQKICIFHFHAIFEYVIMKGLCWSQDVPTQTNVGDDCGHSLYVGLQDMTKPNKANSNSIIGSLCLRSTIRPKVVIWCYYL